MAEAIVSGVLKNLGELISTQAKEKFDLLTGLETKIHNLSNSLKRIQAVLDDAEKKRFKDKIVELWLHDLEDISYEIDDVIDEWNYLIREEESEGPSWLTRVCAFIPCSCFLKLLFVRPDIAVKVKKLNERLDYIEREKNRFSFTPRSAIASSSQAFKRFPSTSILPNDPEMIGRDSEMDTLVSQLLFERHEEEKHIIKILSIVGTGGIGKTTLAQLAYNDARVKDQFEKTGWVCVSNTFDEIKVAKAIVESLEKNPVPKFEELNSLLELVIESTSGKRFLLVLDDVWLEDRMAWEPFQASLSHGAPGSRILLTTRNKTVAKNAGAISTIDLDIMSPSDSWSLFHQIAFVGPNATGCERLENIGKEIAEKCEGLPLAIKVIASFLRCKNNVEDWLNVKNSELWKLKVTNVEIFPHLYLSYNDLSPVLRRCFSYCAVFPQDQLIDVDDLITSWIALGYLESSESEDKMEVEGRDSFEILASRLFLEPSGEYNHEEIMYYRMHDIVHDFALHLTKREPFCEKPRHVTWLHELQVIDPFRDCNMGQARSFVGEGHATLETVASKSLMNSLKLVRLLDLSHWKLELPTEIGNLIHLRYLNLSNNYRLKELPATVYNLYNLQTLKLKNCWQLKEFPPGMEKLKKLRHLIVDRVKFPMGIEELTCLQTLSYFLIGREYNKLGHLKNLNQLRGSLEVDIMDDLEDAIDAQNADLKSKKHIQNLMFAILNSSRVTKDVMKALEPHPKLQRLKFNSYGETELPPWMTSLNDLVELELYNCIRLTALPPLGILPSLETLLIDIQHPSKFEDYAFWARRGSVPSPAMAFPKLKMLEFRHGDIDDWESLDSNEKEAAEWQKWEAHEPPLNLQILTVQFYGRSELPMWMTSLNNLKELSLSYCFNLISLLPLGILPSLERLEFDRCEQLKFVGAAFLGIRESLPSPAIGFPKLEELVFSGCEKLEEWEDISAEDVEDNTVSLLPCLQWLIINYCPNLQTLPHRLLHKASSLSYIFIDGEEYNPSIFLLIASTLAEVKAREPNHKSTSTEEGPQVKPIHPALHPLIYSNDEGELQDACSALSYFFSHVTYGKVMVEAGIFQGIAELLRHRSPHVLIPALKVVKYIRAKNDALIQFEAGQALGIIASRTSEKIKMLIDLGVVPILVELLCFPIDDVRQEAVLALGTIAGDTPECRDLVLGHGALMSLLLQLNDHAELSMQINATWTLCEFFKHKPKPKFEQLKPALPVLQHLIYSNNNTVLANVCEALFFLSDDTDDETQIVIEAGTCQRLVELLQHPFPSVVYNALLTVRNIVRRDYLQTQCIIDHGALPFLMSLLTNNHASRTKIEACSTISYITAQNRDQIQAVIEAGLIASLVNLLQTAEYDIKNVAALAISNAICGGTHEQIKFMASEVCIKSLCDHLVSPNPQAIIVCLRGLENILKVGEVEKNMGNSGDVNYFAQLIEEAEGLEKITNLQVHDNNEVREMATEILANILVRR